MQRLNIMHLLLLPFWIGIGLIVWISIGISSLLFWVSRGRWLP
jgi:hypothetical protein